ncbi:hypothetical protein TD95_000311 [Thielaviopsis punctulata]|uniref:Purine nucleoside permease n=1 Tax=Thielaviopsis punctulata TaxID=72032 RepID=A0A0F4ZEC5_9PEZI|nr:hypothetical protein TD95_000311 [Thielaviopsis punctulata]
MHFSAIPFFLLVAALGAPQANAHALRNQTLRTHPSIILSAIHGGHFHSPHVSISAADGASTAPTVTPTEASGARVPKVPPSSPDSDETEEPSRSGKISPKVLIFSLFPAEGDVWIDRWAESGLGDLHAVQSTTPGLCMLYPYVHCTADHSVCQVTTGMGEINAATTAMALGLSPLFNLTSTYIMVSGIAGVNPQRATLGSVAFAKYAVQVALQYEIDAREIPVSWSTGYVAYGTKRPLEFPQVLYGTEVFELNAALRDDAVAMARNASMADSAAASEYRMRYKSMGALVAAATQPPSVMGCDTATSDVYFSGDLLSEAFQRTSEVWTNGSAEYCMTASEDNAILEVWVRLAIEGLADFSRVMVMRAGSNFDRPPTGVTAYEHLLVLNQNGFTIAIDNTFNAGIQVVKGILSQWDCKYKDGVKPENYVGDVWGSLGGEPDFGPGSLTGGHPIKPDGQTGSLMRRGMGRGAGVGRPGMPLR